MIKERKEEIMIKEIIRTIRKNLLKKRIRRIDRRITRLEIKSDYLVRIRVSL